MPLPAPPEHPQRVDYEYERTARRPCSCSASWHAATARQRRTKTDWALLVASLLEGRFADCEKATLVLDNLDKHKVGAFYGAFEPARARDLVRRIESHHTPKHGSWLNIAENELSAMTRQCLSGWRIGDLETPRAETGAWSAEVNTGQLGSDWRMKIDGARRKLQRGYPRILS